MKNGLFTISSRHKFLYFLLVLIFLLPSCSQNHRGSNLDNDKNKIENKQDTYRNKDTESGNEKNENIKIYLYGEQHNNENIIKEEIKIWKKAYHEEHIRHLFLELPYYTAEFLNIWMKREDDDILQELYDDWSGSAFQDKIYWKFLKEIKKECPDTIFHGVDVGHQYETTGKRYIEYLTNNHMETSNEYKIAMQSMEQGKKYYHDFSGDYDRIAYREESMTQNFVDELHRLPAQTEAIVGIYGIVHVEPDLYKAHSVDLNAMNANLIQKYHYNVQIEDLTWLAIDEIEPLKEENIELNGKTYRALYFGKQDLRHFSDQLLYREFWRLEDSYSDFSQNKRTGDILPYDNYPTRIDKNSKTVFVIDYKKTNKSVERKYYRSNGEKLGGKFITEEFIVE